ncbi:MAG: arginine--tRNA ligase [Polyangiaceae bacterium]
MTDPVELLSQSFRDAIVASFGEEHRDADPSLRRSQHADFQANAAMALGKKLKKPPREVAQAIVEKLALADVCDKIEIAGPGFVNLTLRNDFLTRVAQEAAADPEHGLTAVASPETVVVDYSAPNVAKEMHVGHLRSTIIGDCLARVLAALGNKVIRQNHVGDWGTPFGMLIEHMLDIGEEGAARELGLGDLNAFYQEARKKFDADAAFADRARRRVVLLQGGDVSTLDLWHTLFDMSATYFDTVYRRLGVLLTRDDIAGESFYNARLASTLAELSEKGLAVESQGALCVFPQGFTGREGEPLPLIVRKQDGGYGYATTDLAAIRYRLKELHATRLLYVVGAPQAVHLTMVFQAAREAGWLAPPARAEHVPFGSVLGSDKKMLRTRAGSGASLKLAALIDEAIERAAVKVMEKSAELPAEERAEIAQIVGRGAIKYADLSNDRIKDYVFDWDRMLAFEGNTAPYVMYACARSRSISRKAGVEAGSIPASAIVVEAPAEHALALGLLRFGAVVREVGESLEPHRLCGYLYETAGLFMSFYDQCPVLKAESDATRTSRLALCELTAAVLGRGLGLLGIEAPQRM